ncbi:ABC transporter permease subunit [Plantactinospora sp. S1510]|uniref:ABC transporter permease subunit n=1 Tax=Plantactinospora alkalitolerans TaxID=2789879 RepID=A0ABS0GWX5_9ACTN|nr:ABC transporter permease subunit [Plantactinospora alkalitolerans]MBF9130392.1 ABC transporter permease subunit [Plantactinospora alkalitolerans]
MSSRQFTEPIAPEDLDLTAPVRRRSGGLPDVLAAELYKLVRRPANWLLLAVALVLSLTFTYLVPYAGYAEGSGTAGGGPGSGQPGADGAGLAALLPAELVGNSIGGLPIFLGALMLILGVLTVGGEYGWGTWKTLFTQGPSRLVGYVGKLVALSVATLVAALAVFAAGAAASAVVAGVEGQPVQWPPLAELTVGVGAGWLIATMWACFGAMLAVLLRGVALPVGLGLVWLLAVQNLLASLAAPLLDWVAELQKGLPGPNAGSLVAALGAGADTPGVEQVVGGGQAALTVAGYLVGFVLLAGAVLRRRDIL